MCLTKPVGWNTPSQKRGTRGSTVEQSVIVQLSIATGVASVRADRRKITSERYDGPRDNLLPVMARLAVVGGRPIAVRRLLKLAISLPDPSRLGNASKCAGSRDPGEARYERIGSVRGSVFLFAGENAPCCIRASALPLRKRSYATGNPNERNAGVPIIERSRVVRKHQFRIRKSSLLDGVAERLSPLSLFFSATSSYYTVYSWAF